MTSLGAGALAWLAVLPAVPAGVPNPAPAQAIPHEAVATRGELLYENQCQGCHTSVLHVRTEHRAQSAADVAAWVRHWAGYNKLGWSEDDALDVTAYLLARYYRFPQSGPGPDRR